MGRIPHRLTGALFGVVLLAVASSGAAQTLDGPVGFTRPPTSKGLVRIDADTRQRRDGKLEIRALTPKDYDAWTASPQPRLYWHVSAETTHSARFSLRPAQGRGAPLLECDVKAPIAAGVHEVNLSDYSITLNAAADYKWAISLRDATGAEVPSGGIVSFIVSQDPAKAAAVREQVKGATPERQFQIYATNSYWYDALATIVRLLDSAPLSTNYRNRYNELLRREAMVDVAAEAAAATSPLQSSRCVAAASR